MSLKNIILEKMSYKNKLYFKNIRSILKKFNLDFLYFFPEIYKNKPRIDAKKNKFEKIYKNFLSFEKNYLIQNKKLYSNSEIIFVSHYVGNTFKDKDLDFYFGNLFKYLKEKKFKFSVILINHTEKSLKTISKEFYKSKISRAFINGYSNPLKDSLNILKIIRYYKIFLQKIGSLKLSKSEKKILFNKFTLKSFINSRTSLRLCENLISIFNKNSISNKKIVVTFEGHSFERIIYKYCHDHNIMSFGYFFSVIRKNKSSVFFNFGKKYMPKLILTTGPVVKKHFYESFKYKKDLRIENVGSIRVNKKKIKHKSNFLNTILVCPEGIYSESKLMIEFSKQILRNFPGINIIFRSHPVLDINIIKSYFGDNKINKNFKFSKNSLQSDLKKSGFLLYRGSSVCIESTLNGLVPLYLKSKNEVSLDPLFEVNDNIVFNIKSLKKLISKYGIDNNKSNINLSKIQNYCLKYYSPLKLKKLSSILRYGINEK